MGNGSLAYLEDVGQGIRENGRHGLTVGGWTLRWVGDCWSVGWWSDERPKRLKWREATWHGRLDLALKAMLDHLIHDGFEHVETLSDLDALVRRAYRQIGATLADLSEGDL